MSATLVCGKGFRTVEAANQGGGALQEVVGINGGIEMISWSSVSDGRIAGRKIRSKQAQMADLPRL
jgi:hypothetical protein